MNPLLISRAFYLNLFFLLIGPFSPAAFPLNSFSFWPASVLDSHPSDRSVNCKKPIQSSAQYPKSLLTVRQPQYLSFIYLMSPSPSPYLFTKEDKIVLLVIVGVQDAYPFCQIYIHCLYKISKCLHNIFIKPHITSHLNKKHLVLLERKIAEVLQVAAAGCDFDNVLSSFLKISAHF